jgi:hypothetical protein
VTPTERSYRRMLRLLPAGFRRDWEEDMVNAYMERAESGGPTSGERLSIVALAIRSRLNGLHTSPRGRALDQAVHGLALTALLYQALTTVRALTWLGYGSIVHRDGLDISHPELLRWYQVSGLLWVGAFIALAMGRVVIARVLTVLGALSAVGVTIAISAAIAADTGSGGYVFSGTDITRWAWLVFNVVIVLLAPRDARPATGWWIGGFFVGWALVLPSAFFSHPLILEYLDLGLPRLAVLVGMIVALARRTAGWLLALALIGGGIGAIQLADSLTTRALVTEFGGWAEPLEFVLWLTVVQVALAVVCGIAGLVLLLRLPRQSSPAAHR